MNERNFVTPYADGDEERRLSRAVTVYRDPATSAANYENMQLPTPAASRQVIKTDARDRAIGFNISTVGLAVVVGLGGTLIAIAGFSVPVLSVATLAVFFGLAATIWFAAWIWYNAASPDGIGLVSVLLHYRLLRHEQRSRLERMENDR